ncbi:aminotransferase class V-fold PLP-dependent enzyme [Leeuwenhoekiella sp. NPDC079379]|uniref:aminotransferase class V-fold PLP-dependent enzyme n=1 Tax=Leeuwenhoekiella sp. NPDC079379 TaxID=3364122 RepID=UPI0037CC0F7A
MLKPKKIALALPQISEQDTVSVNEALKANWVTSGGPFVAEFETKLKETLNTSRSIIALNSGTAALHLALTLTGVKRDDLVLCQTMSYVASANPIQYLGARPVFIDSEQDTFNLSPNYLKTAIEDCLEKGKLPAALVVVHSYGLPCKIEEIAKIASHYKIPLIEDAAEALGSRYKNKSCALFGDYGILSFNGNKIITTGGGGALICKSAEDAQRARHLASQSKIGQAGFEHDAVGFNYTMPGLNAALGMSQLKALNSHIEAKRNIHFFYKEVIAQIPGVELLEVPDDSYYSNYWLSCIRLNSQLLKNKSSEGLRKFLEQHEIESRFLWKPLHLQGIYENQEFYGGDVAENLWKSGLCLPSGSGLTAFDLNRIKDALLDYFFN